jgi:MFS family permease
MVAYASVFTLLAEIRDAFGFADATIGVIAGCAFAAGFVAQLGLSRLADIGLGAALLRVGLALSLLGAFWMIAASELWEWVASRTLLGFGAGCVRPGLRRYVIVCDPSQAGKRLGTLAAWEMVGFMLGPLMASGVLLMWGLRAPFMVVAGCLLGLMPFVVRLAIPGAANPPKRVLRTLLKRRPVRACLAIGTAFFIAVGVFEAVWAMFMADLGASQLFIGLTLSLFTLPMVFIAPWAGAAAQRRNVLRLVTATMSVAVVCMLCYGVVTSLWWLCVPLAVHSVVDAITMPATQLAIGYARGEGAMAAGQGLFGATGLAVAALSSLSAGVVYQSFGVLGIWGLAAAAMAVCIILASIWGNGHDWSADAAEGLR